MQEALLPTFLSRKVGGKVEFMKHTIALKQNHEFRRLYNKGRSAVSPYFAIYCRKTNRPISRLGITTGVKLGNAVKRNRARRRIRELYRTNEARLMPGYDIVVVARTRVIYGRYHDLERSFFAADAKAGAGPPPRGSQVRIQMKKLFLWLIRFYQREISPLRPPCCRFIPTCSAYALEAVEKYGAWKGGWLALRRILRCNPFHRQKSIEYDPVP